MKNLLIIPFILISYLGLTQNNNIINITPDELTGEEEVSFAIIENVPVHKDCDETLSNPDLKKCTSKAINKLVSTKFNTNVSKGLNLENEIVNINVFFTINEKGIVDSIKIRAPHPKLEAEVKRVINLIPKFKKPGYIREKPVRVSFFLPIKFKIDNSKKDSDFNKIKIDKYPQHRGCNENLNSEELQKCTTDKIIDFIKVSINDELVYKIFPQGKSTQFQVEFIINKKGKVEHITAKAHKKGMAAEAIRVLKRLPKFKNPGYNSKNEPIDVPFKILMTYYF